MVLVTGASGNVGKAVLSEVARSGARHKAMYRSANEAAKAPTGMETVLADFAKKETLAPALRDVDAVYLVCSPIPDLVQLETNMIDTVSSLVSNMSCSTPHSARANTRNPILPGIAKWKTNLRA